jgi:hypothetical protein
MKNLDELIQQVTRLQQQIDELTKPEVGLWVTWTPTLTQSGAVTFTTVYARYITIANTVHLRARLAVTGAGTAANAISIGGIPAAIAPVDTGSIDVVIGNGQVRDLSAGTFYNGVLAAVGAADFQIVASGNANAIGVTPNFALANGDRIAINATYERS